MHSAGSPTPATRSQVPEAILVLEDGRTFRGRALGAIGETLTHPRYATAIGLLLYGAKQIQESRHPTYTQSSGGAFAMLQKLLDWLRDRFGTH